MKVSDYLKQLQDLVNSNPDIGNLDVIYCSDDEGNDVNYSGPPVLTKWSPSERCFDENDGVQALCVN